MTKYSFFLILTCMMSMFFLLSCEKAEIYKTDVQRTDGNPILTRGDCDDCPDEDDCCCYVALDNGDNNASLSLCGTSDGGSVMTCPTLPCLELSFALNSHTFSLSNPFNFKYNFCAFEFSEFFIQNTSSSDVANVKISCQRGQSTPQEINLQLAANGGRAYILTDGDCEVSECISLVN